MRMCKNYMSSEFFERRQYGIRYIFNTCSVCNDKTCNVIRCDIWRLVMRIWHYKLIPVLPRQQLLGQWRECCAISKMILQEKECKHLLVRKVTEYPAWMWMCYQYDIQKEMKKRGYLISPSTMFAIGDNTMRAEEEGYFADDDAFDFMMYMNDPFPGWHNDRYLLQCYFNLEEKYDCGGIPEDEWLKIDHYMRSINILWL